MTINSCLHACDCRCVGRSSCLCSISSRLDGVELCLRGVSREIGLGANFRKVSPRNRFRRITSRGSDRANSAVQLIPTVIYTTDELDDNRTFTSNAHKKRISAEIRRAFGGRGNDVLTFRRQRRKCDLFTFCSRRLKHCSIKLRSKTGHQVTIGGSADVIACLLLLSVCDCLSLIVADVSASHLIERSNCIFISCDCVLKFFQSIELITRAIEQLVLYGLLRSRDRVFNLCT